MDYRQDIIEALGASRPHLHVLETVDSTNLHCKRLATDGAPHGTAVIAAEQTAGRGRLGREFQSRAGLGLYLSVLWRRSLEEAALLRLPALAAVAALRAIREVTGLEAEIKWPNDLVMAGRKVGGILTESVVMGERIAVVLGIGINVHHRPGDFAGDVADMATSLDAVAGRAVSRAPLAAALLRALDEMEQGGDWQAEYRRHCLTLGREVQVLSPGGVYTATALEVDDALGLTVRRHDTGCVETVRAGEVSVRGLYGYTDLYKE